MLAVVPAAPVAIWLGAEPLNAQPGSLLSVSIVQLTSAPAGKLSVTESPVAVVGLLLVRVTMNPICEPALTVAASAVLVMVITGAAVGVGVGVNVEVAVGVGVDVAVAVAGAVGVGVKVAVGVGVRLCSGVGVNVAVGSGVGLAFWTSVSGFG